MATLGADEGASGAERVAQDQDQADGQDQGAGDVQPGQQGQRDAHRHDHQADRHHGQPQAAAHDGRRLLWNPRIDGKAEERH